MVRARLILLSFRQFSDECSILGRAGVPMEVMGLMLGEFVDEYTVRVTDVFAMPQSGTGVSVEAVDPVFQQEMMDMLKQTGRHEIVVGWYHSHPGFGCWLSGVDVNTQQSFEQLNSRSVAVVIDPIQSVKGKVIIDAFRTIPMQLMMTGKEPRQTTSCIGHLNRPSATALVHGLGRHYYSLPISYRKNALETKMLSNLHKKRWAQGIALPNFRKARQLDEELLANMAHHTEAYAKRVKEEEGKTQEEVNLMNVGKIDPKRRIEADAQSLFVNAISATLGSMIDSIVF